MKPILFNTEMVRAILDGRKTVTRRLIKNIHNDAEMVGTLIDSTLREDTKHIGKLWFKVREPVLTRNEYVKFPYQLGDILYVRETWWKGDLLDANEDIAESGITLYRADEPNIPSWGTEEYELYKWKPSIHMPKEAARIFLRVAKVRVERLQDMDHDAPKKEGIRGYTKDGELYKYAVSDDWWSEYHRKNKSRYYGTYWQDMPKNPTKAFEIYWDSIIDMKNHWMDQSWSSNPWVWVIEFERISKEDAYAEGN